jgi:hypothetical protein
LRRARARKKSVNQLFRKVQRPGFGVNDIAEIERKDAIEYCQVNHELAAPKNDGITPVYVPSSSEIEDATLATKALHSLFRHGNIDRVEHEKSPTSFSFGSNEFVLPPQMSDRVLTCIHDPTDVSDGASLDVKRLVALPD